MKINCCLVAILLSGSGQLVAAEFELGSGLGFDSNPYRLNDSLPVDEEGFVSSEARLRLGEGRGVSADFRVINDSYIDDSRGDRTLIISNLSWENQFSDSEHEIRLSLNDRRLDRTYVSRLSGDTYAVRSTPAGDRYNYDRQSLRAQLEFNLAGRNQLLLDLDARTQNYEDFPTLSLVNLDYDQWSAEVTWRNFWTSRLRVDFVGEISNRDYDSRELRSLDGAIIPGSRSRYDYTRLAINSRIRTGPRTYLYLNISNNLRQDNGPGYYDTDDLSGSVRLRHQTSFDGVLNLSTNYRDLTYDRSSNTFDLETEVEAPDSRGWRWSFSYEQPLGERFGANWFWFAEAAYFDYDSGRSIYIFERETYQTGLRIEL
ncbi:MAG: hypothetical protein MI746_02290 [Pseudomonadales bacterium]|nr:hypothetical protein [Pseudomonadales bacterium]